MKLKLLFTKIIKDYYFENGKLFLLLKSSTSKNKELFSLEVENNFIESKKMDYILGKEIEDIEIIKELGEYFLILRFNPEILTCDLCLFCNNKNEFTKTETSNIKLELSKN